MYCDVRDMRILIAVAEVWQGDIWNYPVFCFPLQETNHYAMKISFCITCMNRLEHLQATLERNILDNLLEGEVKFVLLGYHSTDGLCEGIQQHVGSILCKLDADNFHGKCFARFMLDAFVKEKGIFCMSSHTGLSDRLLKHGLKRCLCSTFLFEK